MNRPPVHFYAPLTDLDGALANPKLTALLKDGYTIDAAVSVNAGSGPGLALILSHTPTVIEVAPPAWRSLAAVIALTALTFAALGVLAGVVLSAG